MALPKALVRAKSKSRTAANSAFLSRDSSSSSLTKLVKDLAKNGPLSAQPTSKRIRLIFNGAVIADSTAALYVWEHERYPQYYLPMQALVKPAGFDVELRHGNPIYADDDAEKGNGGGASDVKAKTKSYRHVVGGSLQLLVRRSQTEGSGQEPEPFRVLSEMVLFAADLGGRAEVLRNRVKVTFDAVDQWLEEDTPIYVHPKDPYKRVDTIQSLRPIRITLEVPSVSSSPPLPSPSSSHSTHSSTITLAESSSSIHLYETSLPTRYYLPLSAINTAYLQPSTSSTECPYKGVAAYHHVVVGGTKWTDLCWWYRTPTVECAAISGLRCFYNEHVDIWFWEGGDLGAGKGEWVKQSRMEKESRS